MAQLIGLAAALALQATPAAQEQRPEVAVVVITLDSVRHGQIKHGQGVLASLGRERWGRYRMIEPTIPLESFTPCEDESPEYGLDFCARFYLHQELVPNSPPHVVVAFDDRRQDPESALSRSGEMRVLCFGRGAEAADPKVQDTWLWPNSARVHGVNDWNRDLDAMAACIDAALSETPGVPRPRPL
jgi:hypothetical protein